MRPYNIALTNGLRDPRREVEDDMAYLTEESGRRGGALAGVAAVHVLLGWALVSGLASRAVDTFIPPAPIKATNVPERVRPAPPPEPVTVLKPVEVTAVAPDVIIAEPSQGEVKALTPTTSDSTPMGLSQGPVIVPDAPPQPQPPAPVLRGAVAGPTVGLTTDDYPDASRRAGEEGAMSVRVSIGTDGRVTACAVTASTGFPRLDARACQVAMRRWRFQPATEDGRPVASEAVKAVRWRLEG